MPPLAQFCSSCDNAHVDVVQAVDTVHHRVVLRLSQQHSIAAFHFAETLFDPPRGFARQFA